MKEGAKMSGRLISVAASAATLFAMVALNGPVAWA